MMKNLRIFLLIAGLLASSAATLCAQEGSKWSIDAGIRGFKYSAEGGPNEIGYNPVFTKWEGINQNSSAYTVSDYQALEPLYFNMNFGLDLFIRYKKHLLIKVGYDYSNPLGIGGKGHIQYSDNSEGIEYREEKRFSYTSHQINYFLGPLIAVGEEGAEVYLGFSPMAPTWVNYQEKYTQTEDGATSVNYDKTFKGFFGSCRALVGLQVPMTDKLKIGSEAVFSFLNYMKLKSGNLEDDSFRFPLMKWNVTARYNIKWPRRTAPLNSALSNSKQGGAAARAHLCPTSCLGPAFYGVGVLSPTPKAN